MNSEKVKEIKNSIERKINRAEKVGDDLVNCVSVVALKEYLTLINELESENERLRNAKVVYESVDYCYEDLKKAEKRIAELESENERLKTQLAQANAGIVNCSGCKLVELNVVKEFAGRLKDRLRYSSPTSDVLELSGLEFDGVEVEQCIDETLKEFIND